MIGGIDHLMILCDGDDDDDIDDGPNVCDMSLYLWYSIFGDVPDDPVWWWLIQW